MKNNNTITALENALTMRKETVSPNRNCFQEILSQIPEKKIKEDRRAVRSPYTWIAITELVTVFSLFIVILPSMISLNDDTKMYELEIRRTDSQLNTFETSIDNEDYKNILQDYTL